MKREFIEFIVGKRDFSSSLILPGGTLSAGQALEVYKNAYLARLTSALGVTYETTWRLLGDAKFFRISAEYIRRHDSRHFNLNRYGGDFPEYVARLYGKKSIIYQMANFEKRIDAIFHLPEPDPKEHIDVGLQPSTRVSLAKTTTLLSADYAVDELWVARKNTKFPKGPKQGKRQYFLIYKYNMLIHIRKIHHRQYLGLKFAEKKVSFERLMRLLQRKKYCRSGGDFTDFFQIMGMPGVANKVF